ncbi:MAG: SufE family protein [Bacteroidota bacterium]|jgi:cysteine desulfuration protein SufE|nr:SufE family protein [Chitinophagaceae bacterium]
MQSYPSISAIEKEIIEDFSMFETWEEKYEYIIDMGKKLAPLNDSFKTDDYKIKGCQSSVWIHSFEKDGRVYFEGDSDAVIVKGLVSLMIHVLSGHTPQTIIDAPLGFIDEVGLSSHLAQTRSNGLRAMIKQMKLDATAFKLKG